MHAVAALQQSSSNNVPGHTFVHSLDASLVTSRWDFEGLGLLLDR